MTSIKPKFTTNPWTHTFMYSYPNPPNSRYTIAYTSSRLTREITKNIQKHKCHESYICPQNC